MIKSKFVITTLFSITLSLTYFFNTTPILEYIKYFSFIFILIEFIFEYKNKNEVVDNYTINTLKAFIVILVFYAGGFSMLYKSMNIYMYIPFVVLAVLLSLFLLNPNNYSIFKDKFSNKKYILIMVLLGLYIIPLMFFIEVYSDSILYRIDFPIYAILISLYPAIEFTKIEINEKNISK